MKNIHTFEVKEREETLKYLKIFVYLVKELIDEKSCTLYKTHEIRCVWSKRHMSQFEVIRTPLNSQLKNRDGQNRSSVRR